MSQYNNMRSRFTARAACSRADAIRCFSSVTNSTYSRFKGSLVFIIAQKLQQPVEDLATSCGQFLSQLVRDFLPQVVAEFPPGRGSGPGSAWLSTVDPSSPSPRASLSG